MSKQQQQMAANLKARDERQRAAQGTPFGLSISAPTPELSERAGVLPERLQELARNYMNARQKAGDSLLDMGRWLSEARQESVHGQWRLFLDATGTSEDQAESFIGVYKQALNNPTFANAVRKNFLSLSAAYELISAPPDVQDRVLHSEQPTTRKQIREEKRAVNSAPARSLNPPADQPMLPAMPAPASPADLPTEYAIIQRRYVAQGYQLLSNIQGSHRAYVTRKEGMTGVVTFDWADVLSKLERLEAQATPAEQPKISRDEMIAWKEAQDRKDEALADLDRALPQALSDAGYFWKSASPPIIAHNDGWQGSRPTFDAALGLAWDRERQKGEAPAPLPPDLAMHRPRRPVSADVSAHTRYVEQLEQYAGALEQLVVELRALLKAT